MPDSSPSLLDIEKSDEYLKKIFMAGVHRVDPYRLIKDQVYLDQSSMVYQNEKHLKSLDLKKFEDIIVFGAGKATAKMAKAIEEIFGDKIQQGLISVKYGHVETLEFIRTIEAGHPVPDDNGLKAANEIVKMVQLVNEKTLVIGLISGGGSALIPLPFNQTIQDHSILLTLKDKQETTKALLSCGATINEINCFRKHLSMIKGGRLAQIIHPAQSINFILSDVVGDRLDCIASGPTSLDDSTFFQMAEIEKKYQLESQLPDGVKEIIKLGIKGVLPETPNSQSPFLSKTENILIGTNRIALEAAAETAELLGFDTEILSSQIIGEAREVAKVLCGIAKDTKKYRMSGNQPKCLITGGETTVTIKGDGKGGRSQEMALSFLAELSQDPESTRGIFFLAASTDGNDGPTDAAGAFASAEVLKKSKSMDLSIIDYLNRNDAYRFFDQTHTLLKTGPTNTNVCDIQLILIYP